MKSLNLLLGNLDALVVSKPVNVRYLCGFVSTTETEIEALLIVTRQTLYLCVSELYTEYAQVLTKTQNLLQLPLQALTLAPNQRIADHIRSLASIHSLQTIGIDEKHLSFSFVSALKAALPHLRCINAANTIEQLRMYKTAKEQGAIIKATTLTDDCFLYVQKNIQSGVSETAIAWMIESYIKTHGGKLAFEPIVAFNNHSSQPHYRPQVNTKLTKPSLILVDFGAQIDGYCSDMTRVLFWGTPKSTWITVYETVLAAQTAALSYLATFSATNKLAAKAVDTRAREIIIKAGYPSFPHGLGHAVGLEIHESPSVSPISDATLEPGMALTIEPGIYLPDQFGIRIEDLLVLENKGYTNLTKSTKEMLVL